MEIVAVEQLGEEPIMIMLNLKPQVAMFGWLRETLNPHYSYQLGSDRPTVFNSYSLCSEIHVDFEYKHGIIRFQVRLWVTNVQSAL